MTISVRLKNYLEEKSVSYEILPHPRTQSSIDSSIAAHIPNDKLAKAVIVKEEDNYLMVVVPSDQHLHLGRLHHHLGNEVGLATEEEVFGLFPDCEEGAVPPIGGAFGFKALVEDSLLQEPDIYFQSGDHCNLVRVSGSEFSSLVGDAERVHLGRDL